MSASPAIGAVRASPHPTALLSGGGDGTLKLWDAASGEVRLSLAGHEDVVSACAWSPDGRSLLSGGDDGHLKLWGAASGELLRVHAMARRTHRGFNGHAVWEPKTNRLIEACGDIWRWLAWVGIDADGQLERLPLETFGPLPAPKQLAKASCGDE